MPDSLIGQNGGPKALSAGSNPAQINLGSPHVDGCGGFRGADLVVYAAC